MDLKTNHRLFPTPPFECTHVPDGQDYVSGSRQWYASSSLQIADVFQADRMNKLGIFFSSRFISMTLPPI